MLTDPQLKSKVNALWDKFLSGGIVSINSQGSC